MATFGRINCQQAEQLMEQGAVVLDIRDPQSYRNGHIPGALALDREAAEQFLATADRQQAVIVCCYHGNSSQGAAQFLAEQGFDKAYSLDGGFEVWRLSHPYES